MSANNGIDLQLYSRQLYVYGESGMNRMQNSEVYVLGLGGLGLEIVKNIVLSGVGYVTIFDNGRLLTSKDLGSLYFAHEDQIGNNRAQSCINEIKSLNPHVTVTVSDTKFKNTMIKNERLKCLIVTEPDSFTNYLSLSIVCRKFHVPLILAQTSGLYGFLYSDFGNDFIVQEPLSQNTNQLFIRNISTAKNAIVVLDQETPISDYFSFNVRFDSIQGMTELNGQILPAKYIDPFTFEIGDTTQYSPFSSEFGLSFGTMILQPIRVSHKRIDEAIINSPIYEIADAKEISKHILISFLSRSSNMSPDEFNRKYPLVLKVDQKIISEFDREYGTVLEPVVSVIGSIASQEVIKAVSSKMIPSSGFTVFSYTSSLPRDVSFTLQNDRYDDYRQVFGDSFVDVMRRSSYLLIGAGAIGCEILKNFAMCGFATNNTDGGIVVIDGDTIERSNLNRQFLFRDHHISQSKSQIAVEEAKKMNPQMAIQSAKMFMSPKCRFNRQIYKAVKMIVLALDNRPARVYMADQAATYRVPLFDSGTIGPSGRFTEVIPDITEKYSVPPVESGQQSQAITLCAEHGLQRTPVDCVIWAKGQFYALFVDENEIVGENDEEWATNAFNQSFYQRIDEILKEHPESEFWELIQKPVPVSFDKTNELHMKYINITKKLHNMGKLACFEKDNDCHVEFVSAAANICALQYHMAMMDDLDIKKTAGNIIPALATTTSLVSGFSCLEQFKVIAGNSNFYESLVLNLEMNDYRIVEETKCEKMKVCGAEFTAWEKWSLEGDYTIDELKLAIKSKYGVMPSNVLINGLIYNEGKLSEIVQCGGVKHNKIDVKIMVDDAPVFVLFPTIEVTIA